MLIEARFLEDQSRHRSRSEFLRDEILRRAFVRSIEVMGEAAKQIDAEFRSDHPEIEWKVIAGMRDRLIHGYFGIDYDIVWRVATEDAPVLAETLEQILARDTG